jgi:phage-related protein
MPTIFDALDQLSGNDVLTQVGAQAGHLGSVVTTIEGLVQHPPQGIGDLLGSLHALPLPNLDVGGGIGTALSSIGSALPSDPSSMTGSLTTGLTQLQGTLGTDLAGALRSGLQPILDLAKLVGTDFTCAGSSPPAAPAAPAAGPPPAPPGGAAAAPPAAAPAHATAAATLTALGSGLGLLPSPFTLDAFLAWLVTMTGALRAGAIAPITMPIPILDEVHDGLETLVSWKAKQPSAILADLVDALTAVDALVKASPAAAFGTLPGDMAALAAQIPSVPLTSVSDGVTTHLGEIANAITQGNLAAAGPAVTALNTLLDSYDAARPSMQATLAALPTLTSRLGHLPVDLDGAQGRLVALLQDSGTLQAGVPSGPLPAVDPSVIDAISQVLSPVVTWLQDIVGTLDLSAIQGPITTVANGAKSTVDTLDKAIADVTTQVQHVFSQVSSLVEAVDIASLMGQLTAAVDGLKIQIDQLLSPVRDTIGQVVTTISQGIDAFHPQDLVTALNNLMSSLTATLTQFAQPIQDIANAVQDAEKQLKGLSFAPVTDQVVGEIGQVTTALQALGHVPLSPAIELALQGAVALLPHDLHFATGPIETEFDQIVDAGPRALVAGAKAPVAQLIDKVNGFEPSTLIGNALSGPFDDLIAKMQAFKPSALLDPLNQELGALKTRLLVSASPGRLLDPLQAPFDELLAGFDRLEPEVLVKPLQAALSAAIDAVLGAIPIDDLVKGFGDVLAKVQSVTDSAKAAVTVFGQVHGLLAGLADGPGQLEAWVASIVATVGQIGDTSTLAAEVTQLSASIDTTKAAALGARLLSAVAPAVTALDALGPQARLTAMVQAYRAVPAATLAAIADSVPPQKAAITQVLARVNPLQPAFATPFEALAALRQSIGGAETALTTALTGWDARYHAPDGVLACLAGIQPTEANLTAWLDDAATTLVVRPLRTLLALVGPVAAGIEPVVTQLQALVADLTAKVTALVSGPGSVGAISDAVDQLVARLRQLDLGFLTDSLKDLFGQIRTKLAVLDPSALKTTVDAAFAAALGTLDVHQILPPADVQKLDEDYAAVIVTLQALDPGKLVVDVVQPQFDSTVKPLISAFDLSGVLDTVTQMLEGMKTDLSAQLDKVDTAYQEMLAAVPSLSPTAIAGDVAGAIGDAVGGSVGGGLF